MKWKEGKMHVRKKSILWVLIKKQITQSLSFTKSKKSIDFLGSCLYLALIGILAYVFLSVFSGFIDIYCNITFYGKADFAARQYELLSIAYLVAFVLITLSSISAINKTLFENEDIKIMTAMPISSGQLFWSKMIVVYIKQIVISFVVIMSINLSFSLVAPQPVYYYLMSVAVSFIFPLLTISVAAVLALPVHFLKSFLSNKYIVVLILISLITTLACAGYANLIDQAKYLIVKGEMNVVLNENTMDLIAKLAKFSVPANFFAGFVIGQNVVINLLIILAISAVSILISLLVIKSILRRAIQNRLTLTAKPVKLFGSRKQKKPLAALVAKEFNTIFRTPSYTFLYFSMAVAMPVMATLCMSMGVSFIRAIILAPINFEIALFLILIFGVLTNTFCSTNISRDGISFFTAKAMPVSIKQTILAKILLCLFVALLSTLLSVMMFYILGYITFLQSVYIFIVAMLLCTAQICFATRLDFNRPKFCSIDSGQIKESNTTMSIIIVVGLGLVLIIGFSVLYLAIMSHFRQSMSIYYNISKVLTVVVAAVLAFLSYLFLTKNLEKKYYNFIGGADYE